MDALAGIAERLEHRRTVALYGLIKQNRHLSSVRQMCRALDVSPSGYYSWVKRVPSARMRSDAMLLRHINTVFVSSNGTYGARRVHRELQAKGLHCGLHRVERLMRFAKLRAADFRNGIWSVRQGGNVFDLA